MACKPKMHSSEKLKQTLYRLAARTVHRLVNKSCPGEIYAFKINASDRAVVHCPEIYLQTGQVGGAGPLCRTWNVGRNRTRAGLHPYRQVKIVKYVKCLGHSLFSILQDWSCSLEECRADEA